MRGKACSAEFMRRLEKMVKAAGGLKAATKRGALRPIVQAISHQTCLKERTVYQLLQVLNLERSVIKRRAGVLSLLVLNHQKSAAYAA